MKIFYLNVISRNYDNSYIFNSPCKQVQGSDDYTVVLNHLLHLQFFLASFFCYRYCQLMTTECRIII
jgi:hypothetical protein